MIYEAGRSAGANASNRFPWEAATAVLACLCVGQYALMIRDVGGRHRAERALIMARQEAAAAQAARLAAIAAPTTATATATVEPPADLRPAEIRPSSYLALSRRVRSGGLDEPYALHDDFPEVDRGDGGPRPSLSPLRSRDPGSSFDL